jgi:hypothetical protein
MVLVPKILLPSQEREIIKESDVNLNPRVTLLNVSPAATDTGTTAATGLNTDDISVGPTRTTWSRMTPILTIPTTLLKLGTSPSLLPPVDVRTRTPFMPPGGSVLAGLGYSE